jgi:hypothetical protein
MSTTRSVPEHLPIFVWNTKTGVHKFSNVLEPSQNFRRKKGDIKQIPYWGPTNIRRQCTKFSCHKGDMKHVTYWGPTNIRRHRTKFSCHKGDTKQVTYWGPTQREWFDAYQYEWKETEVIWPLKSYRLISIWVQKQREASENRILISGDGIENVVFLNMFCHCVVWPVYHKILSDPNLNLGFLRM